MIARCPGTICNELASGLIPDQGTLSAQRNQSPSVTQAAQHARHGHKGHAAAHKQRPVISHEPLTDADVLNFAQLHESRSVAYKSGDTRVSKDMAVQFAIAEEAGASEYTAVTYWLLKQMVVIESGGKRDARAPNGLYVGLLQMGEDACDDVDLDFSEVSKNWRLNLRAGRLYAEKHIKSLEKANIAVSLLHIYLAHQQGFGGLKKLVAANAGEKHGAVPPKFMSQNVSGTFKARIEAAGQTLTEKWFYLYWQGIFTILSSAVANDEPTGALQTLTVQQILAKKDYQI